MSYIHKFRAFCLMVAKVQGVQSGLTIYRLSSKSSVSQKRPPKAPGQRRPGAKRTEQEGLKQASQVKEHK